MGQFGALSHNPGTKSILVNFKKEIGRILDQKTGKDLGGTTYGAIKCGEDKVHISPQNVKSDE